MPDTEFFQVDEGERIRRLNLCFDKYPELEAGGISPDVLVMRGLVPGHFDLMADGSLVTADATGVMVVEASREIVKLTSPPAAPPESDLCGCCLCVCFNAAGPGGKCSSCEEDKHYRLSFD